LLLLTDPQDPLSFAAVIFLLAAAAIAVLLAGYGLKIAMGLRGGRASEGELHDAIFGLARRLGVPLRRLYVLPDGDWPQVAPSVGSKGDLMIPERLVHSASRREIDGVVAYQLMLIKNRYLNMVMSTLAPMAITLVWRAYVSQTSQSENGTLLREIGIIISGVMAFQQCLTRVNSRAEAAFKRAGGDGEGCVAGLARIAKLSGFPLSVSKLTRTASRLGVSTDRVPILMEGGLPESGQYATPNFERERLVLLK